MATTTVLLLAFVLSACGEELMARATIRFPNEFPQQHNGPDIYAAESQSTPLILQSPGVKPMYIFPQAPSSAHPFGKPNAKGFSQGYILQDYSPPVRQESEFHHTVPPPLRSASFGLQKPMIQSARPKPSSLHTRQVDRHRFGSQRHPQYQPLKGQDFRGPSKPLFSPKPKDNKSQLSEAIHKYSSYSSQPEASIKYNKNRGIDYADMHKTNFKGQREHEIPIIKGSIDYSFKSAPFEHDDFSNGNANFFNNYKNFPNENFEDYAEDQQVKYYTKDNINYPQTEEIIYKPYQKEFNYENKFQDYQFGRQEDKLYIPLKEHNEYQSESKIKDTRGAVPDETKTKYLHSSKYKKTVSGNSNPNYDFGQTGNYFEYQFGQSQTSGDVSAPKPYSFRQFDDSLLDKSGSEWTPINAPEGAVPAKSYDIPAPDLSRGFYSNSQFHNGHVEDERIQRIPEHLLSHSFQKNGNSEEVVSAVVMVKQ